MSRRSARLANKTENQNAELKRVSTSSDSETKPLNTKTRRSEFGKKTKSLATEKCPQDEKQPAERIFSVKEETNHFSIDNNANIGDFTNTSVRVKTEGQISTSKITKQEKYIGAHVSISGGLHLAVERALEIGAKSFAMFLRSQRQWAAKPLKQENADLFHATCQKSGFSPEVILPHGIYLMNCGSPDSDTLGKSRQVLVDELKRCEMLGLTLYNFHPGSSCGKISVTECLELIAESINLAHQQTKYVITVLENMSCQGNTVHVETSLPAISGAYRPVVFTFDCVRFIVRPGLTFQTTGAFTKVGGKFEELRGIIDRVHDKSRVGVCFDTCHAFAAGYDLSTKQGFENMTSDFEDIIGFEYLKGVHLNDSKGELGCHLDRHENIGKGKIGKKGFQYLMNDKRFNGVPMVLETPCQNDETYAREIALLYSMQE